MSDAWAIAACRTPRGIGKHGRGTLHPQHLSAVILAAIRDRNDLDTGDVHDVIWSASNQSDQHGRAPV
jgi:acetyl-CoA C-acetyltransferase